MARCHRYSMISIYLLSNGYLNSAAVIVICLFIYFSSPVWHITEPFKFRSSTCLPLPPSPLYSLVHELSYVMQQQARESRIVCWRRHVPRMTRLLALATRQWHSDFTLDVTLRRDSTDEEANDELFAEEKKSLLLFFCRNLSILSEAFSHCQVPFRLLALMLIESSWVSSTALTPTHLTLLYINRNSSILYGRTTGRQSTGLPFSSKFSKCIAPSSASQSLTSWKRPLQ